MEYDNFDSEMDMPTPCEHCGQVFDLNDGHCSAKWHPNTTICESCYHQEEREIEEDDRWQDINNEISNALYDMDKDGAWEKISDENKALIIQIVSDRISDKEIERVACEEVQNEDYDSISVKNTFIDAFEKGAKWLKAELYGR